jgi:hypothetical protein
MREHYKNENMETNVSDRFATIAQEARKLAPEERAQLVDDLMESLHPGDERLDALMLTEAKDRLAAIERGEMGTTDVASAIARIRAK